MKASPLLRIALTAGATTLVMALAVGYRILEAHGVFTTVKPGFAGTCEAVPGIAGPEDIAIDKQDKLAFISARNLRTPSTQDGIYSYAYETAGARPVKLAGAPKDFHPHGISLYRAPDGRLTLMAVNHHADGTNAVVIFSVTVSGGVAALSETGDVGSGALVSPNDVVAVDADRFYVVNDRTSKTKLGRWLEANLVLPRANLLYFDGMKLVTAVSGLNSPLGIALSADGRHLYVPELYPRQLVTFEREPFTGRLNQIGTLSIPAGLDNADVAADGSIWVAGHPKVYALWRYFKDASKPSPSEIFRVATSDGVPQSATPVYADMGHEIGAASVGATDDGHLLIGSPFDDKFLNCRL